MFCPKCGSAITDESLFCKNCGERINNSTQVSKAPPKIVLDPSEIVEQKETKDTSQSFAGQGKTIGLILMILSIVGDLVSLFIIGFDAFIPVTIGAAVLFGIGYLLRMFSP